MINRCAFGNAMIKRKKPNRQITKECHVIIVVGFQSGN